MSFAKTYLQEVSQIASQLDPDLLEGMAQALIQLRARKGRLFILGVGGSAANASHAVNDFRKICGLESYAPTDNVSELTARTNDSGWDTVFIEWLKTSRLGSNDGVLILSVGGGSLEKKVSVNLVQALHYAKQTGSILLGIVGSSSGCTAELADACAVIPSVNDSHRTPHAEAFQTVILHLLVSHPELKLCETKWEGLEKNK